MRQAGLPTRPTIRSGVPLGKFPSRHRAIILIRSQPLGVAWALNFENPSAGTMNARVFVALARVAPVNDENAAVRAAAQVDATEPGVPCEKNILAMLGDVAAAELLQDFLILRDDHVGSA